VQWLELSASPVQVWSMNAVNIPNTLTLARIVLVPLVV
jgi:phosphatidylglycerophosphate synthase